MERSKRELREEMKAWLRAATDLGSASARAVEQVKQLPEWRTSLYVLLYVAFGNELFVNDLFGEPRRALCPRVCADGKSMEAVWVKSLPPTKDDVAGGSGSWRRSATFGFVEPLGAMVDPTKIDLALVPGLAFTRTGLRLGRGKGHFDRFLPNLRPDCMKVGVCHDVQIVDNLPTESHDVRMDAVVTPSRVYRRTDAPPAG